MDRPKHGAARMAGFSRVLTVCRRDIRLLTNGPAFAAVCVLFALLAAGTVVGARLLLSQVLRETAGLDPLAADAVVTAVVGGVLVENALYALTLLPFPLTVWIWAAPLVMHDKVTGNLETLLATPLSLRELWAGKTLTLTAAASGIGLAAGAVALSGSHIAVLLGLSRAVLLVPAPALVASVLLNPLLFSGMCALIVMLAIAKDADSSILPSFLIGMGAMIGVPAGIGTGVIRIGTWRFCLYQAAAAAALWAATAAFAASVKKETVVRSSRT